MLILALLLVALAGAGAAEVVVHKAPATVPGAYTVELPADYDSARSYPLVVALHGMGDRMEAYLGTNDRLCPEGAIGLYPESPYPLPLGEDEPVRWTWWHWPDSGSWLDRDATVRASVDWVIATIRRVSADYPVNPGKVFLFGFSQGGFLTYAVGLAEPALFAGLLPAGGWLEPAWSGDRAQDRSRPPVRILHGAEDPVCDPAGAERALDSLRARGITAELLRYPARHELTRELFEDARDFIWCRLHEDEALPLAAAVARGTPDVPEPARTARFVERLQHVLYSREPAAKVERALVRLYEGESLSVRQKVLYLLGARRCTGAVAFLHEVLAGTPGVPTPAALRRAAFSALVKLGTPRAWAIVAATEMEVAVRDVVPGSQAAEAGLRPGDVIVSYDGKSIARTPDISVAKSAVAEGQQEVELVIRRAGSEFRLVFKPGSVGVWTEEQPRERTD
ncbi:MAG: PDZ domain-containing protein [bacterium]